MSSKVELIEFVRTAILKSEAVADNQKTLHFQRVAQAVNYAFDTLLSQIKLDDNGKSQVESLYVKHYYNQPVSESNGYRYFGVSDDVAPVGTGIWYVQPSGGGVAFSYFNRPSNSIFASIGVGEVMNETFWRFGNLATKKQIILENVGSSPNASIRFVDYGIVRSFASYDDTEEVVVPMGNTPALLELCTAWLGNVYTDRANNNA